MASILAEYKVIAEHVCFDVRAVALFVCKLCDALHRDANPKCQPFRNMKDIFQESGDIFRNAAYFNINVVKYVTKCIQTKLQYVSPCTEPLVPPAQDIADSFTSTSSIIFSRPSIGFSIGQDLYNLWRISPSHNFFLHGEPF